MAIAIAAALGWVAGLVLALWGLLIYLRHRDRLTTLARLRWQWGRMIERDRDMARISAWHAARSAGAPDTALDQRTCQDLNLDSVFAVVDRTVSTVGQQALYARLHAAPAAPYLDAFEALVDRFTTDVALREQAQLALSRLTAHSGYELWRLTGPFRQIRPLLAAAAALQPLHTNASSALTGALVADLPRLRRLRHVAMFLGARELHKRGAEIGRVLTAVGEVDAALAVASFRAGARPWTRPRFVAAGRPMILSGIRHPLLPDPVPSSMTLGPPHGVIVTGSNMSGKSTFLRTLGVTVVLAQTIHTCLADDYEAPIVSVRTCIGRADDPATGRSYYLAEVDAVLSLIRAAATGRPHIFLFDELFRGTNTTERIAAGEAVLATLIAPQAPTATHLIIAATHDLELVELLGTEYEPYHFADAIDGTGLAFDYVLRPGSATTRNAIALLRMRGAPPELVERALARVAAQLDANVQVPTVR